MLMKESDNFTAHFSCYHQKIIIVKNMTNLEETSENLLMGLWEDGITFGVGDENIGGKREANDGLTKPTSQLRLYRQVRIDFQQQTKLFRYISG